ncbi:MAG: hypothetical protein CMJ46_11610 [Planctomyces sp.]|nr:hypothetical protein [Planctomyces sp.]
MSFVIELLKERERAFATISFHVDRRGFFGRPDSPRMDMSYEFFADWQRNEKRYVTKQDSVQPPAEALTTTHYFNGQLWQSSYSPLRRPDSPALVIGDFVPEPELVPVLGYGGSLLTIPVSADRAIRQQGVPFSQYLSEIDKAGLILKVERMPAEGSDLIIVEYIEPTSHRIKSMPSSTNGPFIEKPEFRTDAEVSEILEDPESHFCHRIRLVFNVTEGMTPRLAEGRRVMRNHLLNRWSDTNPTQSWQVEWMGYHEFTEQLWLPEHARATIRNGQAVEEESLQYHLSEILVNEPLSQPLFSQTFPAGTVFQDNRDGQTVYRLLEEGSPLESKAVEILDQAVPVAGPAPANRTTWDIIMHRRNKAEGRHMWLVLGIPCLIVIVSLIFVIHRRIQRKRLTE